VIHYKLTLIACSICLSTTTALAAVTESSTAPMPTTATAASLSVVQIIDRNVAAKGGLRAWQQVRTLSMAGKIDAGRARTDGGRAATVQDPVQAKAQIKAELRQVVFGKTAPDAAKEIQLPFQMELTRPFKSRLEIAFQGDTAVQVYDGTAGWKLRPFLGRRQVEPFSAEELKAASEQQALDGPLVDYAAKGTQVALEGSEMVEGSNAYKLKLTLKNGDVRHLWIDAQTFLDVKIDAAPRRVDGKLRTVVTYFRDYKPVDGLQIAHRLETAVEGEPGTQRILIEKVALNPVLEPSRFTKPM
jgi:hypothetical protein